MDVWQITVAALRRWYILLPLLALTAFGAMRVGEGVAPEHEATATAILVPGTAVSEIESPYGNREGTSQVLGILLNATEARNAIAAQGLNPDYEVDTRDRSSILNMTVLSATEQESLDTLDAVLALGTQELVQRQDAADIPADAQIGLQVLQPPAVTAVVAEGKLRNMAIVGIVGAGLSLLIAVLFDDLMGLFKRWLGHARERRAAKRAPATTDASDDPRETPSDHDHVAPEGSSDDTPDTLGVATAQPSGPGALEQAGTNR